MKFSQKTKKDIPQDALYSESNGSTKKLKLNPLNQQLQDVYTIKNIRGDGNSFLEQFVIPFLEMIKNT